MYISHISQYIGRDGYNLFLETSVRIEPPTETDIAPYAVVCSRKQARFDVLQFKDEQFEYKQVLAMFSLRRAKCEGFYKNRTKKY